MLLPLAVMQPASSVLQMQIRGGGALHTLPPPADRTDRSLSAASEYGQTVLAGVGYHAQRS